MIADARALRIELPPRDLKHRDGQIDHLSSVLSPVAAGGTAEHVCIYGPSGSGKTTLAKYVLGKLESEALDVRWGYVNCIGDSSKQAALAQLVRDAGLGRDLRRTGTPTGAFLDRLREYGGQVVTVIDEVDVLAEPRVICSLADLRNVSVICITIDQDEWLARVDDRVRGRLRGAEAVTLDPYSHDELLDILSYRVTHGLVASRVADAAVDACAAKSNGNARVGIMILRRAAKHVQDEGLDRLTADVVDAVSDEARADVRALHRRSLGTHQRVLLGIITEASPESIDAGDVHARYEQRVDNPKSQRMRRQYLTGLERYNLIESEGSGRWTAYTLVE